MISRVVLCQLPLGQRELTLRQKLEIIKRGGDFVCLPEYFFVPPGASDFNAYAAEYERNVEYLAGLSRDLNVTVIGGSIVMKTPHGLHNSCFVFSRGYRIGSYEKVFPTVGEMEKGISPGESFRSWKIGGIRIGVLLCADVLHPECFDEMERQSADIIFVPTTSPYRPDDTPESKTKRDEGIFVRGAQAAKSYVVKTCATGAIFGKRLQGRSLIASPKGLSWNVFPESENSSLIYSYDLDIESVRSYRRSKLIASHVFSL